MTQVNNPLDDSPLNGPAFAAKNLKTNDIIKENTSYSHQFRVVFNGENEIQLERYETHITQKQKRISHDKLDAAGFVHIGRMPGFFSSFFVNVVKF